MTARTVRSLAATAAATLTFGGLALAGAPSAFAAPGDSGDIKVHSAGTPSGSQRDEARVCRFSLAASGFETVQQVNWTISRLPSANGPALSGQLALAAGAGHTDSLSLPSGQYRLTWTFQGQTVVVRPKAFRVACPGDTLASPPPADGNGDGGNGAGGNRPGPNGQNPNGQNPNGQNPNGQNPNGQGAGGSGGDRGDWGSGRGESGGWNGGGNGWNGGQADGPPRGAVGAGGGGSAVVAAEDSSAFGVGAAVAAGLAGTVGLVLIRRSRRRGNGAA
ncbi:hypothetical protein [Streptomyces zaomyceticus]|uniref:hypothetical protein n=1 Tax=Streptomyces zaomyceticus TaxID=68286 RepID=UPI0016719D67|nr:hypothetical protein [Streptomyces zaomyceticus]GHG22962.1 hypothetical protein GCM10018791_42820 [Streptomyces zaomyceticus]